MKKFNLMNAIQLLGRSLMLPIAVLPVAGILLRVGQPDLLNIAAISAAGSAIFDNLALIFAIGVAIGIAKDNHGAAALGGATAFLILNGTLEALDKTINMGVLGGILCGIIAGAYYNRYKDIKLPEYLAFFGGRRFIPIVSGATALVLAYVFSYLWPPIQDAINGLGTLMIESGSLGLFFYGVLNRLLIVTGLHHVINNLVWFQFGTFTDAAGQIFHGDLTRFFKGDPTAGTFMAGMFPVMMFGLPGVALAMYRCAKPERRTQVAGLLFSLALTSFLTGITEPIEFAFMFLSPLLYAIHAVLTGVSMVVMGLLGVKLGFTFSAGAFDYVLSYGISTNGWMLLPVGLIYFFVYYAIFSWAIRRFNLKVIGREDETTVIQGNVSDSAGDAAKTAAYVDALGGPQNLASVGACTTRLRLVVRDQDVINEPALKSLGAMAVMKLRDGNVQVILGPIADNVAEDIRQFIGSRQYTDRVSPQLSHSKPHAASSKHLDDRDSRKWQEAFGGRENIKSIQCVATTRLRLEVRDPSKIDNKKLLALGAEGVDYLQKGLLHILFSNHDMPAGVAYALEISSN